MKKYLLIIISGTILLLAAFAALVWNGTILLNNPLREEYPVRGVDVSSYQGDIDWQTLASQEISFVFIKATEGSSFVDDYFEYNYREAQKTRLRVGAYHFFSYDSGGKTQAENFIRTVEACENMLPPVIDLEFYGNKEKNPPDQIEVREQLTILITALEAHYGMKPILYATQKSYDLYLAGAYEDCDIWIRSVIASPALSDGRQWAFWQYTDRARLDGYHSKEKAIDMNVFHGTKDDFINYEG